MSQNKVSAPQFSFALSSSTSGGTSELYLGGANSARYSGDIEWHSVASKSFWVVKGNAKVNQTAAVSNAYMIIDTGRSGRIRRGHGSRGVFFADEVENIRHYRRCRPSQGC